VKIKTDVEFINFGDGVCDIYTEDEDGVRVSKYTGLGFSNRVLGFNRVFAAAAAQVQANAVIRIPKADGIDTHDSVEIKSVGRYSVELVQVIFESNPPSIDLTLRQLEMFTL